MREELDIPHDALVVGFAGRLTQDKGLPELVSAFEMIERAAPAARLLLVGWFDAAEDTLDQNFRSRFKAIRTVYVAATLQLRIAAPRNFPGRYNERKSDEASEEDRFAQ